MMRRVETVSPQVVETVQYASLMKELQRAIVSKKEPPSVTSPLSNSESQSHSKSSDAEFSKELEAALQLIQVNTLCYTLFFYYVLQIIRNFT